MRLSQRDGRYLITLPDGTRAHCIIRRRHIYQASPELRHYAVGRGYAGIFRKILAEGGTVVHEEDDRRKGQPDLQMKPEEDPLAYSTASRSGAVRYYRDRHGRIGAVHEKRKVRG